LDWNLINNLVFLRAHDLNSKDYGFY